MQILSYKIQQGYPRVARQIFVLAIDGNWHLSAPFDTAAHRREVGLNHGLYPSWGNRLSAKGRETCKSRLERPPTPMPRAAAGAWLTECASMRRQSRMNAVAIRLRPLDRAGGRHLADAEATCVPVAMAAILGYRARRSYERACGPAFRNQFAGVSKGRGWLLFNKKSLRALER